MPIFKRARKNKIESVATPIRFLQFDLFDMKSLGSKFVKEFFTVFKIPRLQSRRSFISLNEMAEKMAIPTSSTCHFEAVED